MDFEIIRFIAIWFFCTILIYVHLYQINKTKKKETGILKKLTSEEIVSDWGVIVFEKNGYVFNRVVDDLEVPEGWYKYSILIGKRGFCGSIVKELNSVENHYVDFLTQDPILELESGESKIINLE